MSNQSTVFTVDRPEDMNRIFATAYNSGLLDNLLNLYEPEARLATPEKTIRTGLTEISDSLQNLLKLGGEMRSENQYAITANDIALIGASWIITTTNNLTGEKMEVRGQSAEIVRRQANGSWKYLIDHPFGAN